MKNICLGKVSLSLETIKEWLEQFSKTKPGAGIENIVTVEIPPTQYLQQKALLHLIIRKMPPDVDTLHRKCEELKKKISELINWVQEFRKETSHHNHDYEDVTLDYNLCTPKSNGVNLLQAAVHLGDVRLVSRLLELGADPYLSSVEGSTFELAAHLVETGKSHVPNGYNEMVNQLLLEYAAANPRQQSDKEEISFNDSINQSPIENTTHGNNTETMEESESHNNNSLDNDIQHDTDEEHEIPLPEIKISSITSLQKISSPTKRKNTSTVGDPW